MDQIIAQKFLDACAEHEESWDGEKYTKEITTEIFEAKLTDAEKATGLAICLMTFGSWWSDVVDICVKLGAKTKSKEGK